MSSRPRECSQSTVPLSASPIQANTSQWVFHGQPLHKILYQTVQCQPVECVTSCSGAIPASRRPRAGRYQWSPGAAKVREPPQVTAGFNPSADVISLRTAIPKLNISKKLKQTQAPFQAISNIYHIWEKFVYRFMTVDILDNTEKCKIQ